MFFLNKKSELGQVDTPMNIAKSLTDLVNPQNYDYFIDIGAGLGNLSRSLEQDGLLIELDKERFNYLQKKCTKQPILNKNFLDSSLDLKKLVNPKLQSLYLSNPPFNKKKLDYNFRFFSSLNTASKFNQVDIAFLDKVLSSINDSSAIMFIMSSPFVEFEKYKNERTKFINSFSDIEIICLDDHIYADTEVESYAVIAKKSGNSGYNTNKRINLKKMDYSGKVTNSIDITLEEGSQSLSFDYHHKISSIESLIGKNPKRLSDFKISIVRGSRTKKYFENLRLDSIHTTDLSNPYLCFKKQNNICPNRFHQATKNDILITRVGKRAIDRESIVTGGSKLFTDSVYRLSCNREDTQVLWDSISGEIGKKWRKIHAQGKCAKYLTIGSILNMPIDV